MLEDLLGPLERLVGMAPREWRVSRWGTAYEWGTSPWLAPFPVYLQAVVDRGEASRPFLEALLWRTRLDEPVERLLGDLEQIHAALRTTPRETLLAFQWTDLGPNGPPRDRVRQALAALGPWTREELWSLVERGWPTAYFGLARTGHPADLERLRALTSQPGPGRDVVVAALLAYGHLPEAELDARLRDNFGIALLGHDLQLLSPSLRRRLEQRVLQLPPAELVDRLSALRPISSDALALAVVSQVLPGAPARTALEKAVARRGWPEDTVASVCPANPALLVEQLRQLPLACRLLAHGWANRPLARVLEQSLQDQVPGALAVAEILARPFPAPRPWPQVPEALYEALRELSRGMPGSPIGQRELPDHPTRHARVLRAAAGQYPAKELLEAARHALDRGRTYQGYDALHAATVHPGITEGQREELRVLARAQLPSRGHRSRKQIHKFLRW